MKIANNLKSFVVLWRELEHTRLSLKMRHKRFCLRNVLKDWLDGEATDEVIWEVCRLSELEGWQELEPPADDPRPCRELLRAVVSVMLGLGIRQGADLPALDAAYAMMFPHGTPLKVNKKGEGGRLKDDV